MSPKATVPCGHAQPGPQARHSETGLSQVGGHAEAQAWNSLPAGQAEGKREREREREMTNG